VPFANVLFWISYIPFLYFSERKRIKTSDGDSDSDAEVDDEYTEYVHF